MHHRAAAPLLALLLAAVALAGCTGQAPAPAPAATKEPTQAGLVDAKDLANVTQQEEAQSEFAKSLDEKFHTHNYWGSALEKLLMDADVPSSPLVYQNPSNPFDTAFTNLFRFGFFRGALGFTPFELPEGAIIPPETNRVEVKVSWADSPTITGLRLVYMDAGSKDLHFLPPMPKGGAAIPIETNLTANDMPHTTVSKWRFFLAPVSDNGPGVFNGSAHVTVKVFRNDALFVAPPHPDFWRESTSKALFNTTLSLKGERAVVPVFLDLGGGGNEGDGSGFAEVPPPNGTIIPPHTGVLRLTLEWKNNATEPDPFGIRPDLTFVPANTRRPFAPEGQDAQPGKATYTIQVNPKMVDSPYANESEWEFFVFLRSNAPTDAGPGSFGFGSVGVFDGYFTLSVVAEREQLSP